MCQPPAVTSSHLLLYISCSGSSALLKLPHWSFHHSSHPEALRVTVNLSAVSYTSCLPPVLYILSLTAG